MPAGDAGPEPTTTEPVAATTPVPEPVVAAPGTPAPAATAEPEVDPFDDDKVQQFDRAYVEKLRKEAAGHRTKATELGTQLETFSSKFDGLDPEDQEAFLYLVDLYKTDPEKAAAAFTRAGQQLAAEPVPEEELDQPMTRREWIAWQEQQAEEAQTAQVERSVEAIQAKAVSLGYTPGDPDYVSLLYITSEDPKVEGDIDKAHAIMEKRRQTIIDDYVAGKTRKAAEGLGTPAPSGVPAVTTGGPAKTLEEAAERTKARVQAAASS